MHEEVEVSDNSSFMIFEVAKYLNKLSVYMWL